MLPTSGLVYVADIETYACGSAALRAKCKLYLRGKLAGMSMQAKGGYVLSDLDVFVQPFFLKGS